MAMMALLTSASSSFSPLALLLTAVNLVPSRLVRGFVALYVEYHRNVPTVRPLCTPL